MYITYVSIDGDLYCTKTVFVKCNLPLNEDETNKKRYVNNINYICETADHFQWHFWFHSHRVICALISQQNTMSHVVIKCVCAYYTTFVRIWLCHVRKLFVCWHFAEAIRAHDGLCVYLCLPYDKTVYQQPTNLIELRINKRERCVRTEGDIKKNWTYISLVIWSFIHLLTTPDRLWVCVAQRARGFFPLFFSNSVSISNRIDKSFACEIPCVRVDNNNLFYNIYLDLKTWYCRFLAQFIDTS